MLKKVIGSTLTLTTNKLPIWLGYTLPSLLYFIVKRNSKLLEYMLDTVAELSI